MVSLGSECYLGIKLASEPQVGSSRIGSNNIAERRPSDKLPAPSLNCYAFGK